MDVAREDWLLVFIVAAAVLPLGYSMLSGDQAIAPDSELEQYCVDVADSVEANATFADRVKDCRCIPPEQVKGDRFQTPEKVENATQLFLVSCTLDTGQTQVFPIRRIRDGYTGDLNQTNASVLQR